MHQFDMKIFQFEPTFCTWLLFVDEAAEKGGKQRENTSEKFKQHNSAESNVIQWVPPPTSIFIHIY